MGTELDEYLTSLAPAWLLALGIAVAATLIALVLRVLHRRVISSNGKLLRPLRVIAAAVHAPLLALLWIYALTGVLYVLKLPAATPLRQLVFVFAHVLAVAVAIWLFTRVARRLIRNLDGWSRTRRSVMERYLVPIMARSGAVIAPVLLLLAIMPMLAVSPDLERVVRNVASLMLIAGVAAVLVHAVSVVEYVLVDRYRVDVADNLRARRVHTQISVLRKVVNFVIVVLAVATMLTVFERVRQLGATILASAGIVGVVLGFAAQKVLGNILAGIQIALTQPIRIDDAVIVENEWGQVEELTLTYVVVRLWDQRRLVLPITYFIEKPFQNWTRTSAELIGTVFLYVDYSVPVEAVRDEARRIAEASPLWDGRVCVVQVTELGERSVQIRILVSAASGGNAFDLRCEMREKLVAFLHERYPEALPRVRAELRTSTGS